MSSTLITPLIKDVIAELLKNQDRNNFDAVEKIIVSGREGLKAFVEFLQQEVQSVTLKATEMSIKLKNGELNTERSFPLGLWKEIVSYVRKLSISGFDENVHRPMIEAFQHSTRLEKVEVYTEIPMDIWRLLLRDSVGQVRAHTQWIAAVNALEDIHIDLDHLEIVNPFVIDTFKNLLSNFRIGCKSLKIEWPQAFDLFEEAILPISNHIISNSVEQLEVFFNNIPEMAILAEVHVREVLEALQRMFPNVKKANILMTVSVEDDDYNTPFTPHHGFIQTIVQSLNNHVLNADINYDLHFDYRCNSVVIWYDEVRESLIRDFTNNGFEMVENTNTAQLWTYEKKIAEKKSLSIQYKIGEFEMDEEQYDAVMDDLGLFDEEDYDHDPDIYYSYDDDETDYENMYDEEADFY